MPEKESADLGYGGPRDLGFMLYDIDHAGDHSSLFFRATLDRGVMKVPPPESPESFLELLLERPESPEASLRELPDLSLELSAELPELLPESWLPAPARAVQAEYLVRRLQAPRAFATQAEEARARA